MAVFPDYNKHFPVHTVSDHLAGCLSDNLDYNEENVDRYIGIFESMQYLICMSLMIRFREIFDKKENLVKLESVVMDNLGTLPEIQILYSTEKGE